MSLNIRTVFLENFKGLESPQYATNGSAGIDLRAAIENTVVVSAGGIALIATGIAIELPPMYEAQVRPRSGLAIKNGISILNSPGTIDSDYRGEIKVILINLSKEDFTIARGDKIAQMVISKYEKINIVSVSNIDETPRGSGGFGSTGIS